MKEAVNAVGKLKGVGGNDRGCTLQETVGIGTSCSFHSFKQGKESFIMCA